MMSQPLHWAYAALLVAALAGCGRPDTQPPAETDNPAPAASWSIPVEPLSIPAAGQTAYPQLTSSARGIILSWLESSERMSTLKFAEYSSAGWSQERPVSASDNWFISAADVPAVMRMSDGTLVATTYPAVDPSIEAYDLLLSYSSDEGKTWSRPVSPHHDGTKTQHGFASPFEIAGSGLGLVWLDGRAGDMSVYFATFDRAWKQTAESAVDTRVCECCQTSAAMTADGPLVAFRDRSPREIRDIHVSLLTAGQWTQPRPLHVDNWRIEACPVNGPALSARERRVAAAWFTVRDDKGHAYAAFSNDAGRTWGEPIQLDDDTAVGHVDIEMLDDGSAVTTWVEFANQRSQFRLRRVEPSGDRSAPVVIAGGTSGRLSGYPRIARHGNTMLLAWTESAGNEGGGQAVKAALARLK